MNEKNTFKSLWIEDNLFKLKLKYKNEDECDLRNYLDEVFNENFKDEDVLFVNEYRGTQGETKLSKMVDLYYSDLKPCVTEHGSFYMPHELSPVGGMFIELGETRNQLKKERKKYDEDSEKYKKLDLDQSLVKIMMNAWYGGSGNKSFINYNLNAALATTGKGRRIVSTSQQFFEGFLSNNCLITNNNECVVFIDNCVKDYYEKEEYCKKIIDKISETRMVTVEMVISKLKNATETGTEFDVPFIRSILASLSYYERCMVFYKNNLYQLIYDYRAVTYDLINRFADVSYEENQDLNSFKLDKVEGIRDVYNEIWNILESMVMYNHPVIDRVYRLLEKRRKCVVLIDTDSNMIVLADWKKFCEEMIYTNKEQRLDSEQLGVNSLSLITYILTDAIAKVLYRFSEYGNVPEERRDMLAMKNEWFYSIFLVTNGKKNYVGKAEYKEGTPMHGKLDIKGLAIGKTTTNSYVSEKLQNILDKNIMVDDLDNHIPEVIRKIKDISDEIKHSLLSGETKYLNQVRIKDISQYKDPWSNNTVISGYCWNTLYPEHPLDEMASHYKVSLNINTMAQAMKIQDEEMKQRVIDRIFNSEIATIRNKGLYTLLIPFDLDEVPEWIRPFIRYEDLIETALSSMKPILESINVVSCKSHNSKEVVSPIIRI